MTWVIGRAGPFGYAVGLSDIRVTLGSKEKDCLQKIYNIGPQMALGFAGSVLMGLEMVNLLATVLRPPKENLSLIPQAVAEDLPTGARMFFNGFPENVRRHGLQLMLLSAHPTENHGAAPWAKCYVYRFSSPDFRPVLAGPSQIVSIGSGSKVPEYKNVLRELEKDFEHLTLQQFHPDGAAIAMTATISAELRELPVKGISDHLHICVVGRDGVRIGRNDTRVYDAPEESFKMPPVATNLEEFESLFRTEGISSIEEAKC